MKKLVEAMLYDKTGKLVYAYAFSTKTVKGLAGIKRIDELEYDADAQVQLEDAIVDVMRSFAKSYNDSPIDSLVPADHILIFNDYADTVNKYNI